VLREREESEGPTFTEGEGGAEIASGPPSSMARADMGLSTVIGRDDADAGGRAVRGRARSTLERMRVWDRRTQPRVPGFRSMGKAFDEIRTIADKLSLNQAIVEQAAYIYRKAVESKLTRGRSTEGLAAACLYAACRERQVPRSLKDVGSAGNVQMKQLSRSYRALVGILDIKMPVEDPVRSLPRIGSAIQSSPNVMRRAHAILELANKKGLTAGKDPMAQAGAALYLAAQLEKEKGRTQKQVAEAAEVTEVTLRNRYKTLRAGLEL
jgi:transcription initiation factor TFIIB